jgi:CheY-like chemotaxis protein
MEKKPKILVIDDDAVTLRLVLSTLRTAGFDAVAAENALEGIRTVKRQSPDLILMDLVLPGCNGETATESIRLDPKYRQIPVILVSGHPELQGIAEVTGATDCLSKPFNPAELVRRVRRALQLAEAKPDCTVLRPLPPAEGRRGRG